MSNAAERKALIHLIRRQRAIAAIRSELFDKQIALHDDPAQFRAAHPGRRSGKSEGMPRSCAIDVLDAGFNEAVILAAETQKKAKALHWANLHQLVIKHNLPLTPNANEGAWLTPWGARIQFWGLNDNGAVELLRGFKLRSARFDEVQTYSAMLPRLVSTVLEPALGDTGGSCTLYGTPSVTRKGDWADICLGVSPGWAVHHWDVRDNKKFPRDANSFLQQVLLRNKWNWDPNDLTKTHPIFAQEYLGLFVNDPSSQVFKYNDPRNVADSLPVRADHGFCTMGIDYGTTDDPCAWVVVWSPRGSRDMYIVEARMEWNMLPDDAAEITHALISRWNPQKVVGDGGGLGAPYVLAFNRRYGHLADRWVHPADKQGRLGQIAIVNGEIESGRVKVLPAAKALADEWTVLPWKDGKRVEFKEGFLDHLSDAARYAVYAHLTEVPEQPKTAPTLEELAEAAKDERLRRGREQAESVFEI